MLSFFPLDVLDEIWDLTESVSKGFFTYSSYSLEAVGTVSVRGPFVSWAQMMKGGANPSSIAALSPPPDSKEVHIY